MIELPNSRPTSAKSEAAGPEYDSIASNYSTNAQERSDRTCVLVPSARHYLGDLDGMRVLDLACGSGYFTRLLKNWGAEGVVAVDISKEMVEIAQQEERTTPLGIEYRVGDVAQLGKLGEFDIVFAAFLLHYATTISELEKMCNAISMNLKAGGRFVCFNENPLYPVHKGILYDVDVAANGPISDGSRMTRTHYEHGAPKFSFDHFHYESGTYEAAFRGAGLTNVEWLPFVKASNADLGYPKGFWDAYIEDFSITILKCRKAI
jgi:ubiquinone/menaquinone biosynthesis C-methylase UbiE